MDPHAPPPDPEPPVAPHRAFLRRLLWHFLALVVALLALAAYLHFRVEGPRSAATAALVTGAIVGFVPGRDLLRLFFRVEGPLLHLAHLAGALVIAAVPLSGMVSGVPVLSRSAMAPFAMMGAAQALMHPDHPRTPQQRAAMQRFVASLPAIAAVTNPAALHSAEGVRRMITTLSEVLSRAQQLGQTELDADPGFQAALRRSSTRLGLTLALDAIQASLSKLPSHEATDPSVQALALRLAQTRARVAQGAR